MWAEDDLGAAAAPCLQSLIEPSEGKVYTMYHGTSKEAAEKIQREGFCQSAGGMLGRGVYLSRDLEKASRYPLMHPSDQKVVIRVKVNVGKVKRIDSQNHPMRTTWHDHGYDTAWCPPKCGMVPSGLEEDCVWDPKRITLMGIIPTGLQNIFEQQNFQRLYHSTSMEAAVRLRREVIHQSLGGILSHGMNPSRQDLPDPLKLIHQSMVRGMALSLITNVAKKRRKRR